MIFCNVTGNDFFAKFMVAHAERYHSPKRLFPLALCTLRLILADYSASARLLVGINGTPSHHRLILILMFPLDSVTHHIDNRHASDR